MIRYEANKIGELAGADPYVGRGIVIGTTPNTGKAVTAYFIMGRSENSRNRIFEKKADELFTRPFDESKLEDPSLIIYAAVRSFANKLIITNGDQTDTIYEALAAGGSFEDALETRTFEPDMPNMTPRISGMITFGKQVMADESRNFDTAAEASETNAGEFTYKLSILKSMNVEGTKSARYYFNYEAEPGLGHFIHTYRGDGNPLPTFTGEPERVVIPEDIDEFTKELWEALDSRNKISLYVRYTDVKDGKYEDRLINKNE